MITRLAVSGYRSLRKVVLPLAPLTIVTGPNGSGKSSFYRALRLLSDVAQGAVIASLALEGGLASILWAGPEQFSREMKSGRHPVQGTRRTTPVSLQLGFSGPDYGYAIDLGLPRPDETSYFGRDPEIKAESLWNGEVLGRANVFAERRGPMVRLRDDTGRWRAAAQGLAAYDTMMIRGVDPRDAPELLLTRERMRAWRFYDHLRTDRDAPARRPQIGTFTPVLASDGSDVAAAVRTIMEVGDHAALDATISDAFPGASLSVSATDGLFELNVHQHGLLRPLKGAEISDGTLRYLLLTAALLSPRPPDLMILNEPETSLHADLVQPLARLIAQAAQHGQIIVVSHAAALVAALEASAATVRIAFEKELGETVARDHPQPAWTWCER